MQLNGVGVAVVWPSRESVGHNVLSELGLRGKMTVGVDSELGAVVVVAPGAKGMDES